MVVQLLQVRVLSSSVSNTLCAICSTLAAAW
jgi:hypothetical protein